MEPILGLYLLIGCIYMVYFVITHVSLDESAETPPLHPLVIILGNLLVFAIILLLVAFWLPLVVYASYRWYVKTYRAYREAQSEGED